MAKKINSVVGLEVLSFKDKTAEELKNMKQTELRKLYKSHLKEKFYVIDDTSSPYVIRLAVTENDGNMKSLEPDFLPNGDDFEVMESIQEILKENNIPVYKSDFDPELVNMFKEKKKSFKEQQKELNEVMQEGFKKILKAQAELQAKEKDIIDAEIEESSNMVEYKGPTNETDKK